MSWREKKKKEEKDPKKKKKEWKKFVVGRRREKRKEEKKKMKGIWCILAYVILVQFFSFCQKIRKQSVIRGYKTSLLRNVMTKV